MCKIVVYILYFPDQQLPQIRPTFPPIFLRVHAWLATLRHAFKTKKVAFDRVRSRRHGFQCTVRRVRDTWPRACHEFVTRFLRDVLRSVFLVLSCLGSTWVCLHGKTRSIYRQTALTSFDRRSLENSSFPFFHFSRSTPLVLSWMSIDRENRPSFVSSFRWSIIEALDKYVIVLIQYLTRICENTTKYYENTSNFLFEMLVKERDVSLDVRRYTHIANPLDTNFRSIYVISVWKNDSRNSARKITACS